jgi:site-specific DNA recombinase
LRWLEGELVDSDEAKRAALAETARRYQSELSRCQGRLNLLYEDRLDGRIHLHTYDRKAQEYHQQEAQLRSKIDEIEATAAQAREDRVDLAMLIRDVGNMFRDQSAPEQRRLLHLVLQEASWKGGVLRMSLREPFAMLSDSR